MADKIAPAETLDEATKQYVGKECRVIKRFADGTIWIDQNMTVVNVVPAEKAGVLYRLRGDIVRSNMRGLPLPLVRINKNSSVIVIE